MVSTSDCNRDSKNVLVNRSRKRGVSSWSGKRKEAVDVLTSEDCI